MTAFSTALSGAPAKRMFCGADRRIALSAPIFRPLTYAKYAASPEYGGFRALHPNIAVLRTTVKYPGSPRKIHRILRGVKIRGPRNNFRRKFCGVDWRIALSSACGLNSHVRFSTLLSIRRRFSRLWVPAESIFGGAKLHPNIAVLRESDGAHLVRMTAFSTALSGVPAERTFGGV